MSNAPARRSRRTRSATSQPAFPLLDEGTQRGLRRLVSDNSRTVARMLDVTTQAGTDAVVESELVDRLCEQCALVIRQQRMSPSVLLARFFGSATLAEHAKLLGKSPNGTAPVLAERIASEWKKNRPIPRDADSTGQTPLAVAGSTASIDQEDDGNNMPNSYKKGKRATADGDGSDDNDAERNESEPKTPKTSITVKKRRRT